MYNSVEKWTLSQNLTTYLNDKWRRWSEPICKCSFGEEEEAKININYMWNAPAVNVYCRTCFVQFEIRETCIYYCSSMDAFFWTSCSLTLLWIQWKICQIHLKMFKNYATYFWTTFEQCVKVECGVKVCTKQVEAYIIFASKSLYDA